MKIFRIITTLFLITGNLASVAQGRAKRDSLGIFADDKPINVRLITDLKMLLTDKLESKYQNAVFSCKLPDSSDVSEEILIQTTGHFRLKYCDMPSLRLNFRNPTSAGLSFLKELKMVNACGNRADFDQLLIREYLVYKIYNLLTEKSLRVRLLRMTYEDIKGSKKPFTQLAFLIENIDAMAARNDCRELNVKNLHPEASDREQMTMVNVFEYMIGNTDWSLTYNHNIKLISPRKDSLAAPYAVPYDFDFGGLINAAYAAPPPNLPIESVRERLYRGYKRTPEELQKTFAIYNLQKEKIYALVQNCDLLQPRHKKDMINYIEDFYRIINNKSMVRKVFIDDAISL